MGEYPSQGYDQASTFVLGLLFVLIVAIASHLLFSWIGFNPTDDGFILSNSTRLINGEVPHRDFISLRPVGSAILHTPEVLIGGEHTRILARFVVCLELAIAAWCWVLIAMHFFQRKWPAWVMPALGLIVFCISSFYSLLKDPWHTTDGYFFISLGFYFCLRSSSSGRFAGYLLLGLAYLCKQSFILVGPLSLIVLGDWRKIRFWIAYAVPGIVYLLWMVLTGALDDMIIQFTGQTGIVQIGVLSYLGNLYFWNGVVMGLVISLLFIADVKIPPIFSGRNRRALISIVVVAAIVSFSVYLKGIFTKHDISFCLFGCLSVFTIYQMKFGSSQISLWRLSALGLILAWSVSISLGGNFPGRGTGELFLILLLVFVDAFIAHEKASTRYEWVPSAIFIVTAMTISGVFFYARRNLTYRDMPASALKLDLGDVMHGGKGVKTNERTYAFLADLNKAVELTGAEPYCIIPDLAAYWVCSPQPNPLPIDWVQGTELCKPELTKRVTDYIMFHKSKECVIVQKFRADILNLGFEELPVNEHYEVVGFVKQNLSLKDTTAYFEIYE